MRISVQLSCTQKGWWHEFTSAVPHGLSYQVQQLRICRLFLRSVSQFIESNRQQKWHFKTYQKHNYREYALSQAESGFVYLFVPFRRKPEAKTQFCKLSTNTFCSMVYPDRDYTSLSILIKILVYFIVFKKKKRYFCLQNSRSGDEEVGEREKKV